MEGLMNDLNLNIFDEPDWLQPIFQNIPTILQEQPWGVWRAEPRLKDGIFTGKWSKAPRNPTTGKMVGTDKPELFGTYLEAKRAYELGDYTGVGVLLTGKGIVGVDIDDAADTFDINPEIKGWTKKALRSGVYCEASPSSSGLRLFMLGTMNSRGKKIGPLEIYTDVRFLTVTGHIQKLGDA
jgi:primase-polymerase (primpol)-like protein